MIGAALELLDEGRRINIHSDTRTSMRRGSKFCIGNILLDHILATRLRLDPTWHQGSVASVDCEDGVAPAMHVVSK
jgi:hypothetical protein